MPISHRLRALFIHIPKTGGSSIERALGLAPADDPHGQRPNFDLLFGRTETGHLQHTPLAELLAQGHLAREHLDYFKFCFVRNPWDRVVSEYFYRQSFGHWDGMDFATFVRQVVPAQAERAQHFYPQARFAAGLDFVGRFEQLQRDFDRVCESLNIPPANLPHIRRREHYFYADYYTAATRAIVADVYREDLDAFRYAFETGRRVRRLATRLVIDARRMLRALRSRR